MPPIPYPLPVPPKVRSIVPGWRISARVASRAKLLGSSRSPASAALSPSGVTAANSRSACARWAGVSFAKASSCAYSIVSGGAVLSM